jgi:hypothetical protein
MWLLWWMLRAVAFNKEYSFPIQRLVEIAPSVNAWHPWVTLKGKNGFHVKNIVIFLERVFRRSAYSILYNLIPIVQYMIIVQYQEGSN